ncbi:unnamed protein product [Arabidopsis arenosa]|uniref:Uncharacterized protein n=1 Tax=Arabidopsis arenosa TaxID=38785 RepID=A0A8S2ANQ6_ARAAE|nr:unnamed protein product [Arabidopsis arenosa]
MGRAPCCDKTAVKKGPWSTEEDAVLKSFIEKNGTGNNWISLPQRIDNDIKNYWNTRLKKKLMSKQGKAFHQQLNVKFERGTTSSSSTQNQIQMFHDENTKSNQTLYNQVVDPSITSFPIEEQSMIKNPMLEPFYWEPNKVLFDLDHDAGASSYHHHSSPSLNSMSSSSSIGTNSSLQMSYYTSNHNDHGDQQDMFFMAGFENFQAELFDEIANNNTGEIGFHGTEIPNNNYLDHDISSFIDYPLYDNE